MPGPIVSPAMDAVLTMWPKPAALADPTGDRFGLVDVDVREHDVASAEREGLRECLADAGTGARHHRDAAAVRPKSVRHLDPPGDPLTPSMPLGKGRRSPAAVPRRHMTSAGFRKWVCFGRGDAANQSSDRIGRRSP
jgi:hypothetical protein